MGSRFSTSWRDEPRTNKKVLFVGNLLPRRPAKGVDILLKAMGK
jgi:hypothetical protein